MAVELPFGEPNTLPLTQARARKLVNLFRKGTPIKDRLVNHVAEFLERVDGGLLAGKIDSAQFILTQPAIVGDTVLSLDPVADSEFAGWFVQHPAFPEDTTFIGPHTSPGLSVFSTSALADIAQGETLTLISPSAKAVYDLIAANDKTPVRLDLGLLLPLGTIVASGVFNSETGVLTTTDSVAALPGWIIEGGGFKNVTVVEVVGNTVSVTGDLSFAQPDGLYYFIDPLAPVLVDVPTLLNGLGSDYDVDKGRDLNITGRVSPELLARGAAPAIYISLASPSENPKDSRVTVDLEVDGTPYPNAQPLWLHLANEWTYVLRRNQDSPNQYQKASFTLAPVAGTYTSLVSAPPLDFAPSGFGLPVPTVVVVPEFASVVATYGHGRDFTVEIGFSDSVTSGSPLFQLPDVESDDLVQNYVAEVVSFLNNDSQSPILGQLVLVNDAGTYTYYLYHNGGMASFPDTNTLRLNVRRRA